MASPDPTPIAYRTMDGTANPSWLNKGDNAWQMTAATLVGLQGIPGLMILYGSVVKKKWAINSAFMVLYAFSAVMLCWVGWAYKMAFGHKLFALWGKAGPSLDQKDLLHQAALYATDTRDTGSRFNAQYPQATMVYFQFVFAAVTLIIVAGALLGRMNLTAWMVFVPLWLTFSYTVGTFSIWGGGFLFQWGLIDYSGGYVIHLAAGVASFVAAFWVGPRTERDRASFPPNNVLLTLAGAGLLWLGWNGFNGGDPYTANISSSFAVLNTNIAAATSLLVWTALDVIVFGKPSVIGAVQGMITGLVAITPGAGSILFPIICIIITGFSWTATKNFGSNNTTFDIRMGDECLIQGWAAIIFGLFSGSIPWFTMMILHKRSKLLQSVDDTLGVVHTHAVAGSVGGILSGWFAQPTTSNYFLSRINEHGVLYGGHRGGLQFAKQIVGALFIIGWNVFMTSLICLVIKLVIPLRMNDEQLLIGDDALHGEEAYAVWGEGEKYDHTKHGGWSDGTQHGTNL